MQMSTQWKTSDGKYKNKGKKKPKKLQQSKQKLKYLKLKFGLQLELRLCGYHNHKDALTHAPKWALYKYIVTLGWFIFQRS